MAKFTTIESIYLIEMTSLRTGKVYTLPNAYLTLEAAHESIDECKATDERVNQKDKWSYQVKTYLLFR